MARVSVGQNPRFVTRPARYRVLVNGVERSDVQVIFHTQRAGTIGSEATLLLPQRLAGDDTDDLQDALVIIYESDRRSPQASPLFRGFVVGPDHNEDESRSTVQVKVRSVMDLADRINVFQATYQASKLYRARDQFTGTPTGLTALFMVREIFSTRSLETPYGAEIRLGDTRDLEIAGRGEFLDLPDMRFTTNSLVGALRRILANIPDVSFRERFTDDATYLDFFAFGSTSRGARVLRAAKGNGPEQGAYLIGHARTESNKQAVQRVVAYGQAKQHMVTLSSDNSEALGVHPTATLLPYWGDATAPYPAGKIYSDEGLTLDEKKVLFDPDRVREGSPTYQPPLRYHFRRFRVPLALRKVFEMMPDNALEQTIFGVRYRLPIQFFRQKTQLVPDLENPGELIGEVLENDYELISGWSYEPKNGVVLLPAPPFYQVKTSPYGPIWGVAHIYWTVTMRANDGRGDTWESRGYYDTGVRGNLRHPRISEAGLCDNFDNENVELRQVGAEEIPDADGNLHTFPAIFFSEMPEPSAWLKVTSPSIIRDDRAILRTLAERRLMQVSRRITTAMAVLPFIAGNYRPGDGLFLLDRGIDNKRLTITQVSVDHLSMITTIYASDQVPPRLNAEQATPAARGTREITDAARQVAAETAFQEKEGNLHAYGAKMAEERPFADRVGPDGQLRKSGFGAAGDVAGDPINGELDYRKATQDRQKEWKDSIRLEPTRKLQEYWNSHKPKEASRWPSARSVLSAREGALPEIKAAEVARGREKEAESAIVRMTMRVPPPSVAKPPEPAPKAPAPRPLKLLPPSNET
jgi:hypothetical protein